MAERKYSIKELAGIAGALAAVVGGNAIFCKPSPAPDITPIIEAQAVRDSVLREDIRGIKQEIGTIKQQGQDAQRKADSIGWAVKQLSDRVDRSSRYSALCVDHSDRIARNDNR